MLKNVSPKLWILIVLLLNCTVASATLAEKLSKTTSFNEQLNQFINHTMKTLEIETATSIAVVQGDKIIYQNTFGYADIACKILADNDTLFYIASVTKPMFALAIIQALESSPYSLQTTLAEMFPTVDFANNIAAHQITIHNLLTHTSGLEDNYLALAVSTTGIHSPKLKVNMLAQLYSRVAEKQEIFDYTNLGYNILSIWYENAFKQKWQDAVKQHVFMPLNMHKSTAYVSEATNKHWSIAKPYSFFQPNKQQPLYLTKQDNTMHAAGGVLSTSKDMANFIVAQLNQGKINHHSAIPADMVNKSHQVSTDVSSKRGDFIRSGYAYGWYTGEYKQSLTFHHFGAFDGFRPHVSFMPEKSIGLVILNNEGQLNDKLTDLIADFVYGKLLDEPEIESRVLERVAELKSMAKGYRKKIVAKELDYHSAPMQLSRPKSAYVGTYSHPLAGQVYVSLTDGVFSFSWGNLNSNATAYKEIDVMRVKLRPTRPQLAQFNMSGAQPELRLSDIVFTQKD